MCITSRADSSVRLLASFIFQPQDHQRVDTTEVLVVICQACQSWKPLSDNWTTHSHWEHFDFFARLLGSPGLSSAPWRPERSALSSTSRGAECADSPAGSEWGPELSISRRGRQVARCWQVCVRYVSVRFLRLTFLVTDRPCWFDEQPSNIHTNLVSDAVMLKWNESSEREVSVFFFFLSKICL